MPSFSQGSRLPLFPQDIRERKTMPIRMIFPIFFPRFNFRKYTACLLAAIAVILSGDLPAQPNFPFSDGAGYVAGGKSFDHKFKNDQGQELSLDDLKGNVVIILLVTTWCPNCPAVVQSLDWLKDEFAKNGVKNVKIVALNIGSESIEYLKKHYITNDIHSLDLYHSLPAAVLNGLRGVPACFVFDKSGAPVWGYLGAVNYYSTEFFEFIKDLAM
jgi:thiol-disulfide isomerase/thioredoxin